MDTGQAFVGFHEAPINFPPTFKYDVQRWFRHRTKSIMDRKKRLEEKVQRLTEVEEQELEELKKEEAEELGEGELEVGEDASMASSTWTSVRSKGTQRELDEDEFYSSPSSQTIPTASSNVSIARKAKTKWLSLVANSPVSPKIQKVRDIPFLLGKSRVPDGSVDVLSEGKVAPQPVVSSVETVDQTRLRPQVSIVSSSFKSDQPEGKEEDEGKGVYDSSHKKRVPSWYIFFPKFHRGMTRCCPQVRQDTLEDDRRTRGRGCASTVTTSKPYGAILCQRFSSALCSCPERFSIVRVRYDIRLA